jgi:hypothetical protein
MKDLAFVIALGIILLFGLWLGRGRKKYLKAESRQAKAEKVYPLRRKRDHLKRVK